MRESNFSFASQNRGSVCISSSLYDRRAIDAPSPSLPLLNSLTHLAYLTATSPRIREILSLDGGLERLVRILKGCATGPPPAIDENLSQLKGKGTTLAPGSRRSPFRPFSDYFSTAKADDKSPSSSPPATSTKAKHLLYTYTLAFQCIVNIGVRGSELIRTRVVEAGALDVVVHVLERYLEEVDRRRAVAEVEWRGREASSASRMLEQAAAATPVSRPLLSRLRVPSTTPSAPQASGSLSATSSTASLAPPPRVSTPDTLISMDADDNASSSGQEADGDGDATEGDETASQNEVSHERRARSDPLASSKSGAGENDDEEAVDRDGDVVMDVVDVDAEERARSVQTPRAAPARPMPSPANEGLQFRDEDVLLSLQLLAYLSKYPHVRSVFHSPSDELSAEEPQVHDHTDCGEGLCQATLRPPTAPHRAPPSTSSPVVPPLPSHSTPTSSPPILSSNVFSLVEAFTHRPPVSDQFTPRHSSEVQYWAGVIMRNACRKDELQGGIRQCANMQCGVWENYPREFAKCRRCRKAKYCSKSCQSKAWQFGHRYWCAKAAPREVGDEGAQGGDEQQVAGGAARRAHRHHHHHEGGARFEEEEDEVIRPPPTGPTARLRAAVRPHGLIEGGRGGVGVAGMGMRVRVGMDEDEVVQEMMGGGVFGDLGGGIDEGRLA